MKTIQWTGIKLVRFKIAYRNARVNKAETFHFEGNEFVTNYAKYLIEYLDSKFKQ